MWNSPSLINSILSFPLSQQNTEQRAKAVCDESRVAEKVLNGLW